QESRLDQLLDRMKRTVQEAEETEPGLAKGLYDTARKADEQKLPDTLKISRRLLDAGIPDDAARAARTAGQGIGQLRQGVERAADRILGDQTEALRRAQGELDELGDQVDREIAQKTGRGTARQRPAPDKPADEDKTVDPFDALELAGPIRDRDARSP